MRTNAIIIYIMAAVFFMVKSATAQTGPKIQFEQHTIEYGEVDYASDGERLWTFKNMGTEPLMITAVKGSCGCTVAKYPKSAILPGKEGVVKIKYDTKRVGIISKTVSITTNEPEDRNFHVIKIMGKVKADPNAKTKAK
jgi:hypothetical protein